MVVGKKSPKIKFKDSYNRYVGHDNKFVELQNRIMPKKSIKY